MSVIEQIARRQLPTLGAARPVMTSANMARLLRRMGRTARRLNEKDWLQKGKRSAPVKTAKA